MITIWIFLKLMIISALWTIALTQPNIAGSISIFILLYLNIYLLLL